VLVVRDRQTARQVIGSLPASARVVTLLGEVFHGTGAVVAGPENRSNTIGRPRRIQELQNDLGAVEEKAKAAQERIEALEADLGRRRARERELNEALKTAGLALNKVTKDYQQAVLQVEQVRQRREYQSRQLADLDGQVSRAEQEMQGA